MVPRPVFQAQLLMTAPSKGSTALILACQSKEADVLVSTILFHVDDSSVASALLAVDVNQQSALMHAVRTNAACAAAALLQGRPCRATPVTCTVPAGALPGDKVLIRLYCNGSTDGQPSFDIQVSAPALSSVSVQSADLVVDSCRTTAGMLLCLHKRS